MPILLISALLLAGLGYWEYKRIKAGSPALPGYNGGPKTPEQVVIVEAPSLNKEVLDLYYNGQNAQAMHQAASEMEKYGFFDVGMLLHKRADELLATSPTPPMGTGPLGPSVPVVDLTGPAIIIARTRMSELGKSYNAFDANIKAIPPLVSLPVLGGWTSLFSRWNAFSVREINSANLAQINKEIEDYRQLLANYRSLVEQVTGVTVKEPVVTAPFRPGTGVLKGSGGLKGRGAI